MSLNSKLTKIELHNSKLSELVSLSHILVLWVSSNFIIREIHKNIKNFFSNTLRLERF